MLKDVVIKIQDGVYKSVNVSLNHIENVCKLQRRGELQKTLEKLAKKCEV
jgi:hypothetical protein